MASFLFFSLSNNLFLQYSFLFFSLISYFLYQSSAIDQHPLCNDGDRSSLLQFKQSFVYDKFSCDPSTAYTKLSSWKDIPDDDCCSWDGVDCDQTGHVTGLDLSSSCLYGSINSSSPLFRLVHLKSLNLSLNNFNLSRIPGGIRNLSELKHLNLSWANFSGQIPSEILELSQMVSLSLGKNPLVLQKPSLKEFVETLTNLTELRLGFVNISSHVPQSLSNLTSLMTLFLTNCSLHGEFPPAIFQLNNLRFLSLQSNPDLTGYLPEFQVGSPLEEMWLDDSNFSGQLPHSIGNLKSLSHFSARRCSFVGLIPSSIGNLTKLNVLDLSENYFSGNIPSSSLGNLLQLTFLSLYSNNFGPGTLDWIGKLTNLQTLELWKTNSYGLVPSSFRNLTQLTDLLLASNNITGEIPSWVGNLTQLIDLDLSDNKLQGSIPESVFGLPNLQVLSLNSNNLNGSLKFESFLQMKHLSRLQLNYNHLSIVSSPYTNVTLAKFHVLRLIGCNLREFPSFLRGQNELEYLELASDNMEGYIPNWISTFENLAYLNLGNNSLTGFEHPVNIHSFPSLLGIGIPSNKFEGPLPIPPPSIQVYDVSENKFSGDISELFCNLTSILLIDLSSNNLSGRLPPCLGNLQVMYLRYNEFEGPLPIPPPSIVIYVVSQNKFSGEISPLFCNLTSVLILDLSNNNLHGNLPSCLGNLGNFASVLDLRNNSLSGKIPDNFTSGCSIKLADFSQNQIEGNVPRSFSNCSKLEILNLEKNQMDDVFPSWLGILPHLRVLSLRSNKFHGAIGPPLTKFEFGQLQIIDLSNNNFTGKFPVEYFQNWVAMKTVDNDHLQYMHTYASFKVDDINLVNISYPYSISIVIKGTYRAYVKILEFLVVVDLSSNKFEGEIPETIGTLGELQWLNLSNNMLTGHIPSFLGNLTKLESLDLSLNNLSGEIPIQLVFLTSLAVFNVSHNSLTGPIPHGNQFNTFENNSFSVNPGLCGLPLSRKCGNTDTLPLLPSKDEDEDVKSPFELYWEIMLMGFGSGLVIGVTWGCAMDTRKYEWLVRRKFARRRRRRTRRNSCL